MLKTKCSVPLLRVFWVLFLLAAALVVAAVLAREPLAILGVVLMVAVLFGTFWLCRWERVKIPFLIAGFCLLAAWFLYQQWQTVLQYYVPLKGDPEAIYTAVRELMADGKFGLSNTYFLWYPHQRFITFQLTLLNRLLVPLGMDVQAPYLAYGILAAGGIDLAILFVALGVGRLKGLRMALCTGAWLLMMLPLRQAVHFAYNHNLALPYFGAFFSLLCLAQTEKKRALMLLEYALAGIFSALAGLMTGEAGVAVVAAAIFLLFANRPLAFLQKAGLFFLGFVLVTLLFNLGWKAAGIADTAEEDRHRFPLTHWMVMGLSENGMYDEDVFQNALNDESTSAKNARNLEVIGQRLNEMGPGGLAAHLWSKIRVTWQAMPYVYGLKLGFIGRVWLAGGMTGALFVFSAAAAVQNIRRKKQADMSFFCCLSLFGAFLFLLLWETNPTYTLIYLPLLALPAMDGAELVYRHLAPKQK